jgi:polyphosphate kinase
MVEPIMGFCTNEQNKRFLKDVTMLEEMLIKDRIEFFKFYFSVSKKIQKEHVDSRKIDPLSDQSYSGSLDDNPLRREKMARINCMKFLLSQMNYTDKLPDDELIPDLRIIISGIDELKHMEENLMTPDKLHE